MLVCFTQADQVYSLSDWGMPQYAIISNTVHITEICAALAATADHHAQKVGLSQTPANMQSTSFGCAI